MELLLVVEIILRTEGNGFQGLKNFLIFQVNLELLLVVEIILRTEGNGFQGLKNFLIMIVVVDILFVLGHKKDAVDVVYTPWTNLKKTGDMVAGQVGFHDDKQVNDLMNSFH